MMVHNVMCVHNVLCILLPHSHSVLALFTVYKKLKGDQAVLQAMVYVLANLVGIGLGLYKFHNMGLLPTAQSDWLEFMEERQVREGVMCCALRTCKLIISSTLVIKLSPMSSIRNKYLSNSFSNIS